MAVDATQGRDAILGVLPPGVQAHSSGLPRKKIGGSKNCCYSEFRAGAADLQLAKLLK
jgi:hypothetical protein